MNIHSRCFAFLLLSGVTSCTAGTKVFTMPTSAMEPTIREGEKFTAQVGAVQPKRGDLVIFEHEGILQVKRVIGIAGDVLEGRNLQIWVNGKLQQEGYVEHTGKPPFATKGLEMFSPVTVPVGELFVAGDNRDYSYDSRNPDFGAVTIHDLRGMPIKVVQSPVPARIGVQLK